MTLHIDVTLDYAFAAPTDCLLQVRAAEQSDQTLTFESLDLGPTPAYEGPGEDGVGARTWCRADHALTCRYRADVEVSRVTPSLDGLQGVAPADLPEDVVKYLFPSRYCPSDKFLAFVAGTFGIEPAGARIAAMRDFVLQNFTYVPGSSGPETSALETFVTRQGVCRDFAHMLVTLARASTIPARMVSAYGLNVWPPDFHAVVEVWLDGAWHMIDPTAMSHPYDIARICVGRDASDVAFLTTYGRADLRHQSVTVNAS